MTYFYNLYNIKIKSNIEINDMIKLNQKEYFDLEIDSQMIKNESKVKIEPPFLYYLDKDTFYLIIRNVAIYRVSENKIYIEYSNKTNINEISLFLLGSCFAFILYKKGQLPIHASSIETKNGCVFFCGDSGVGKSTTLNAFIQKGYKMISDDVTSLSFENNKIVSYPSFPKTKIWEDTAKNFNIDISKLNKVHQEMNKYSNPIKEDFFSKNENKPYILYDLNISENNKILIEEIKGIEKIKILLKNSYRFVYVNLLKKEKNYFEQISLLADNITIKRVFRSKTYNSIKEITEILEKDFIL
ncbi:MAG: hypothetical protein U0457_04835 [Candidatus Sericytochromatia bacterium]